ncbi:MAG: hypothetical protein R3B90_03675 [Planctomycetaceae bacterium]
MSSCQLLYSFTCSRETVGGCTTSRTSLFFASVFRWLRLGWKSGMRTRTLRHLRQAGHCGRKKWAPCRRQPRRSISPYCSPSIAGKMRYSSDAVSSGRYEQLRSGAMKRVISRS